MTIFVQRALEYLVLFILMLTSLIIWSGYSPFSTQSYNDWRLFEIVILFILNIYYFFIPKQHINIFSTITLIIYILFFIGLISSYQSTFLSRSLRDWALYASIFSSIFSLGYIIKNNRNFALYTFLALCAMPLFFIAEFIYQILFYYLSNINDKAPIGDIWLGQFSHPRIFGDTALPTFFMLYAATLINQKYRLYFSILLIFLSTLIVFCGGRGLFISFLLTFIFGYYLTPQIRKDILYSIFFLIIGFSINMFLSYMLSNSYQSIAFRQDSSGRSEIISYITLHIMDNLFLGISPAQFYLESVKFNIRVSHPHNLFLQILVEWGLIAFILFIILLIKLLVKTIKSAAQEQNKFNYFIILGVFSFLVNCNFNGAHIYPSSQIYGLFLMAWLISIYFMQEHNIKYQSFKLIHYITATVQLSVGLILVITTFMALGCGSSELATKINLAGPRFWLYDSPHSDQICLDATTFFDK